eukprot:731664_1
MAQLIIGTTITLSLQRIIQCRNARIHTLNAKCVALQFIKEENTSLRDGIRRIFDKTKGFKQLMKGFKEDVTSITMDFEQQMALSTAHNMEQIQQYHKRIQALTAQNDNTKHESHLIPQTIQLQLDAANDSMEKMKETLRSQQQEMEQKESAFETLRQEYEMRIQTMEHVQQSTDTQNNENIENIKGKMDEIYSLIASQKEMQIQELLAKTDQLKETVNEYNKQRLALRQENEEQMQQLQTMKDDMEQQHTQQIQQLKDALKAKDMKTVALGAEEAEKERMQQMEYQKSIESWRNKLDAKEEEIAALNAQLVTAKKPQHALDLKPLEELAQYRSLPINPMVLSKENEQSLRSLSEIRTLNAEQLAQYIDDHKERIDATQMNQMSDILRAQDHLFVERFVHAQGLTHLCILCIDRDELLLNVLLVFETIINSKLNDEMDEELIFFGYNLLRQHSDCIQCITDCFESKRKDVKAKVMRLLTSICITDDDGFEAVLNALHAYGDRHDASSIFDDFVRCMYFEDDLPFRRDALKFINVIINIGDDLELRIESRHVLTELGFDTVMHQLWDVLSSAAAAADESEDSNRLVRRNANIARRNMKSNDLDEILIDDPLLEDIRAQLKLYLGAQEDDNAAMVWNGVDLNEPHELCDYLFSKAVQQGHVSDFIHTLVAMCSINDDSAILWSILPQAVLQITEVLDELDDSAQVFQDVQQLKKLLDKMVQKTQIKEDKKQQQQMDKLQQENAKIIKENIQLKKEQTLSPFSARTPSQVRQIASYARLPVVTAHKEVDELKEELNDLTTRLE